MNDIGVITLIGKRKGFVIVDSEDFPLLNQSKWHASGKYGYPKSSNRTLHRIVNKTPPGFTTDHINGYVMDCRKRNFRTTTRRENVLNAAKHVESASQYKGVSWNSENAKWRAKISPRGKTLHLGLSDSPEECARMYDRAAKEHYGKFARLNFPNE